MRFVSGEMIEAFGDAPGGGMRAPCGLRFGEAGDEGLRVGVRGGVGVVESFEFGVHAGSSSSESQSI